MLLNKETKPNHTERINIYYEIRLQSSLTDQDTLMYLSKLSFFFNLVFVTVT